MANKGSDERFSGISDAVVTFMDGVGRFLVGIGLAAAIGGIVFMILAYMNSGSASAADTKLALQNMSLYREAGLFGFLAAALGTAWLMWGEETSGPILLVVGCAIAFCPAYISAVLGSKQGDLAAEAVNSLSVCGYPPIIVGFLLLGANLYISIQTKARQGAMAAQLKYGKGLREEKDIQNVFLGKCWQLPYCRKFVREKCPIYHSKRTCWKEQVGCMCEESVIRDAMGGKVIPHDVVAAAKYIPYNNRLTKLQKFERCKVCTIYNEHQKQKYKVALPATAFGVASIYVVFHEQLSGGIKGVLLSTDKFLNKATFGSDKTNEHPTFELPGGEKREGVVLKTDTSSTSIESFPYHEIMLFVFVMVFLAYCVKAVEHVLFKMKL